MMEVYSPFIPLLVFLPVILTVTAVIKYRSSRRKEFRHLSEFFISLSFVTTLSWLLWHRGPAFIILSMLPWPWTLRTIGLIFEDLTGNKLYSKTHYYILGGGAIVSIILLIFSFPLSVIVTPFSISVGLIGLTFFFQTYQIKKLRSFSPLHHFNFFLMFIYLMVQLTFGMWVSFPYSMGVGMYVMGVLTILICASIYPLYAEIIFEKEIVHLERVLRTRNKQLFSYSGFSEFKILSAGVTHEVNNALNILNAKIEQLLRGHTKNLDRDLRILLKSTDRIVKSMRGLREFIYPNDIDEKIELSDLVDEVLALYGQRLFNHGIEIKISGLENKYIKGRRISLEQVFLSLINNSIDNLEQSDEKWISISGKTSEDHHTITFQDGSHSQAESMSKLLSDPYFTDEKLKNNGIRLILTKDIIERHGGQLRCPMGYEKSTFIMSLPIDESGMREPLSMDKLLLENKDLH